METIMNTHPHRYAQAHSLDPASEFSEAPQASTQLQEAPIALCINGICQAVMMATPSDLEAFALGFVLSEGLICRPQEIIDIDCTVVTAGWQVDIRVLASAASRLKQRRRLMAGPSGCGLCGIDSLAAAMALPQQNKLGTQSRYIPDIEAIQMAVQQLPQLQKQRNCSRGHHGAAFFNLRGQCLELTEDVGRHSALDKLIGRLAMQSPTDYSALTGFALLTSRCSHDLIIKAARARLPALVTLAPPTNLAMQSAQQLALPLFCYQQGQLKQFA